jgi:hypothetical protein
VIPEEDIVIKEMSSMHAAAWKTQEGQGLQVKHSDVDDPYSV